jgi:hypothetical protein
MKAPQKPSRLPTARQKKAERRIKRLLRMLDAHDSNIALLHAFNAGHISLKGKDYTRRAANYRPTPQDKARLPFTLANLNAQRALLRQELAWFEEYGAC